MEGPAEIALMSVLYVALLAILLVVAWLLLDAILFALFWMMCLIFGRNPAPATVPNKSVWG